MIVKNINKNSFLERLLTIGIEKNLVSEINGWLTHILTKLDIVKVMKILNQYDGQTRDIVIYHLEHYKVYYDFVGSDKS